MASVDVVIPCYNYGRFLHESVSSVLSQEGVDLRVLIIDNASTDDSAATAREIAAADPRVEVIIHPTNRGATFSYNEGIDWASSDYFLILDADDLLAPGSLLRATTVMEEHPDVSLTHGTELRIVSGNHMTIPESAMAGAGWKIATGRRFIEELCRTPVNTIGANTAVRRTATQKRVGYYNPALRYTDDLEMWLRLAAAGNVASTCAVQAVRRIHEAQMSSHYRSFQVRDFREREAAFSAFFSGTGRAMPDARQLFRKARRGLGQHAYWSAVSHCYRGYWRTGLELFRFSVERRPVTSVVPPISWLFRMETPVARMRQIATERSARHRSGHGAEMRGTGPMVL